jgi:hypothetical protein
MRNLFNGRKNIAIAGRFASNQTSRKARPNLVNLSHGVIVPLVGGLG